MIKINDHAHNVNDDYDEDVSEDDGDDDDDGDDVGGDAPLVRNVLGTLNLGDILSQRETIAREMQVLPYIVILENVFVSSCILSSILRDNELIAIEWLLSLLQY